jgi:hypothetical protein
VVAIVLGVAGATFPSLQKLYSGEPSTSLVPVLDTTPAPAVTQGSMPGAWQQAPARLLQQVNPDGGIQSPTEESAETFDLKGVNVKYLVAGVMAGTLAAFMAVVALIVLTKSCATCVVRTALLFSSFLLIVMGMAMIGAGASYGPFAMFAYIGGCILIALGLCSACYWLCCAAHLIEFTARVCELVATITLENMGMFAVSVIGCVNTVIWSAVSVAAFFGAIAYLRENADEEFVKNLTKTKYGVYVSWFVGSFTIFWGGMVIAGVCYTTYCGVFARWYYSSDPRHKAEYDNGALCGSYMTAQFWNFGSICFGTGLLAFIRAMELVARMGQRDAQEGGDLVTCLITCCVRCILECIGDIIEFFNEWGFCQCAIRNASYCNSVKMVFGLLTWRNALQIVSSWVVDSVVNFGSFFSAVVAGLIGLGLGYLGNGETALLSGIIGFFLGMFIGWNLWSIFTAGSKTLLTCWCEHPDTLFNKADDSDYEGEDGELLHKKLYSDFNSISPPLF